MRKLKDNILSFLLYLSAFATVGLLVLIVGFIFIKGIKGISLDYIFSDYSASGDGGCLLYTSPSPRDGRRSRMPSSA